MSEEKENLIYGFHTVEAVISNDVKNIKEVWVDKNRKDKRIQKITELLLKNNIKPKKVFRDILDKKIKHKKHQGIVALYQNKAPLNENDLQKILEKEKIFLLVLDQIQDPHNLGAILRTASAFEVDAVIATKNQSTGLTPMVRKISSGGSEKIPFIQITNLTQTLKKLKKHNIWCIGATGDAKQNIYEENFTNKTAVVVGSEGKGLRKLTRKNCDSLVRIPINKETESLNVSVATGIILSEITRQLKKL